MGRFLEVVPFVWCVKRSHDRVPELFVGSYVEPLVKLDCADLQKRVSFWHWLAQSPREIHIVRHGCDDSATVETYDLPRHVC